MLTTVRIASGRSWRGPFGTPTAGIRELAREGVRADVPVPEFLNAPPSVGLPYGSYPRLALAWLSTEAVRTRLTAVLQAFAGVSHCTICRLTSGLLSKSVCFVR